MQANAFKFFEHKFSFSQMKCSVTSVLEKNNIKALQKFPIYDVCQAQSAKHFDPAIKTGWLKEIQMIPTSLYI